jgi:hypothetical protein
MGHMAGRREFGWFKQGKNLSRKEAMRAKCYECNGEEESGADCLVDTCPMYSYRLHPAKALPMSSPEKKRAL